MISSILIITFSLVLFVYWFRYTCILMLRTKASFDYSADVVTANHLKFPEVQGRLAEAGSASSMDALHESLAHDYRLLTYLLQHTAGLSVAGFTLEQRVLMFDFRVMQIWYALTKKLGLSCATSALQEMSHVLNHFANAMGERAAANSRA